MGSRGYCITLIYLMRCALRASKIQITPQDAIILILIKAYIKNYFTLYSIKYHQKDMLCLKSKKNKNKKHSEKLTFITTMTKSGRFSAIYIWNVGQITGNHIFD